MANRSNESSRQKRARENRARRAALQARTKAAQTPAEQRAGRVEAAKRSAGAADDKSSGSRGGSRRQVQGRLGQEPVDISTLEGSFIGKVVHVPGGMQVIMASVLVVVLTGMGLFMNTVPPEGAEAGADATRTLIDAYGAGAALFLGPPLILVGNALFFSLHDRRRRMWVISAVMLAIFSALMLQYVFPASFLAYAAWRSKRIEDGPATRAKGERDQAEDAEEPVDDAV